MSENLSQKDKIILDCEDSKALLDHFGRLSPGDEVKGSFVATLDEAGEKVIALSIKDITIEDAAAVTMEKTGDAAGDDEPAAITVMKNDNGTPEQEGSDDVSQAMFRA